MPDSIFAEQVLFCLGEKESYNGMTRKGDTIYLPAGHEYTRLYFLTAATDQDCTATFCCEKNKADFTIPSYMGFIGDAKRYVSTMGFVPQPMATHISPRWGL